MSDVMLSEDQRDALQEVANIGMGRAGDSIARALNEFVTLSIPRILILRPDEIGAAIKSIVSGEQVTAVRQGFYGGLRGEAIVIYGQKRCNELAELLGYETDIDRATENELLLDVSNILVGTCLSGIAEQLKAEIGFSAPSTLADNVDAQELIQLANFHLKCALFVEVNFKLERRSFSSHLIILMPEREIREMSAAIDRFIESY